MELVHIYILLFGFFTPKESVPPFLRTCFNRLSHFFLISSLLGPVNKNILVFSFVLKETHSSHNQVHNRSYQAHQLNLFLDVFLKLLTNFLPFLIFKVCILNFCVFLCDKLKTFFGCYCLFE